MAPRRPVLSFLLPRDGSSGSPFDVAPCFLCQMTVASAATVFPLSVVSLAVGYTLAHERTDHRRPDPRKRRYRFRSLLLCRPHGTSPAGPRMDDDDNGDDQGNEASTQARPSRRAKNNAPSSALGPVTEQPAPLTNEHRGNILLRARQWGHKPHRLHLPVKLPSLLPSRARASVSPAAAVDDAASSPAFAARVPTATPFSTGPTDAARGQRAALHTPDGPGAPRAGGEPEDKVAKNDAQAKVNPDEPKPKRPSKSVAFRDNLEDVPLAAEAPAPQQGKKVRQPFCFFVDEGAARRSPSWLTFLVFEIVFSTTAGARAPAPPAGPPPTFAKPIVASRSGTTAARRPHATPAPLWAHGRPAARPAPHEKSQSVTASFRPACDTTEGPT